MQTGRTGGGAAGEAGPKAAGLVPAAGVGGTHRGTPGAGAPRGRQGDGRQGSGAGPGGREGTGPDGQDRILTVPNAISMARLLGVPVFLWLVLGPEADAWAVGLLALAGVSDWLDGKIARALNQYSRLGQMLDPAADRLYIGAIVFGLAVRGIIPWWLTGLLAGRELVLGITLLVVRHYGYRPLQVSFVGKTATLCLLYAFPLLFLGAHGGTPALIARIAGWAFAIWGSALYWWAAWLYVTQARHLIASVRREAGEPPGPPGRVRSGTQARDDGKR